jgi:FHA domain-containing protein/RDD family protein
VTSIDRAARHPSGTARARAGQVAGAFGIDLLALAAFVGLTVAAAVAGQPDLTLLAVFALAGLVVGQVVSWSQSGRSLGYWVTGVRQVSASDGAPPGLARALGANWLADVRHARDPVDPEITVPLLPPVAPVSAPSTPRHAADASTPGEVVEVAGAEAQSTSRALLVIDGRVSGAIGDGVVIGRNPTPAGSERAVSVADLQREISKVHLALQMDDDGRVWAIDRQSTNGSTITRRDGVAERLTPAKPVELTIGDVVQIGSHTISVQFVTEVRVAKR